MTPDGHISEWTKAILRVGLDAAGPPSPPDPPSSEMWETILTELRAGRVVALAVHAVLSGHVTVSAEQGQQLIDGHALLGDGSDRCDELLATVLEIFERHSIDYRVTKGVATSHLVYPDRTWRLYGDADVLVRSTDLAAALTVTEEAGFGSRVASDHRRRYYHAIPIRIDDSGTEVDLHRTLGMGYVATRLEDSEWFSRSADIDVAGHRATSCDLPDLLLHACFHAASQHPHLSTARDIVQLATHSDFDTAEFERLIERSQSAPVVEQAVRWAEAIVGIPLTMTSRVESAKVNHIASQLTKLETNNPDVLVLTTFLGQPGFAGKLGFLRSALREDDAQRSRERGRRIIRRQLQRRKSG